MQLSFGRLMIGPNVSVLIECKPDEPKHDQDGSGHHHPMRVFPIEEQLEHFGHCFLSRYFPFALVPADINARMALSRTGPNFALAAATENYLRQGLSRATGGNNARSFALQTPVLSSYPCLVDERLFHWSTKQSADGPRRLQQFQLE